MKTGAIEIKVPDIGDFDEVEIIEILVAEGEQVSAEDPLITLESDKATMEIPAPQDGAITKLLVKVGQMVSEGTPIALLAAGESGDDSAPAPEKSAKPESEPKPASQPAETDATAPEKPATQAETQAETGEGTPPLPPPPSSSAADPAAAGGAIRHPAPREPGDSPLRPRTRRAAAADSWKWPQGQDPRDRCQSLDQSAVKHHRKKHAGRHSADSHDRLLQIR